MGRSSCGRRFVRQWHTYVNGVVPASSTIEWWLARFRYGSMEWLWRGFTYRQVPPLRVAATPAAAPTSAA
ncbi:MAG: DUF418 domain-containing protein [Burkholderiaceae bacterium]